MQSRRIIIGLSILAILGIVLFLVLKGRSVSSSPDRPPRLKPKPQTEQSKIVLSYLKALYPQSTYLVNSAVTPEQVNALYDSLMWYYLPLAKDIDATRKGPIKGPYKNQETQWFLADGADCGDFSPTPGNFTCSVFGGSCNTWEFGSEGDGGRPYQYAAFIKPYGMRDGAPSGAYIESVAFVCESLGRMLLSPKCENIAPTWDEFITAAEKRSGNVPTKENYDDVTAAPLLMRKSDLNCPNKKGCNNPNNDAGCKVVSYGSQIDTCCWDYANDKADDSSCGFPSKCMATQDKPGGPVFGNYCATPCGFEGCDASSNCEWLIDDKPWQQALASYKSGGRQAAHIIYTLQHSAIPSVKGIEPTPRHDKSVKKTMFYWCKGYGKFLNMGNTGVYFNYAHFLLTCPKLAKDGKTTIRWSYPQFLQTATLQGGNSGAMKQLEALVGNGYARDSRRYLEGYVTTLRGSQYEGVGGVEMSNKMVYKTENVSGLVNPMDDDNLKAVANITVTKYYDPSKKIKNPQYNKVIENSPLNAIYLQQGMIINGATSTSIEYPYVSMSCGKSKRQCGTFPFGNYFRGAALGGCVYKMIDMLGWKSAQFTQMPTGAGGRKYCNAPEHDYEIVYIADKKAVCSKEMVMLDPVVDLDNYIKHGFVDGNKYSKKDLQVAPFNATKMSLTERNVPDDWNKPMPNTLLYKQPTPPISYTFKCPYTDDVFSKHK